MVFSFGRCGVGLAAERSQLIVYDAMRPLYHLEGPSQLIGQSIPKIEASDE
jgi:hypothetical protein